MCLESGNVGEELNKYNSSIFTKEKDMENSEIRVENANIQGQFETKYRREGGAFGRLEEH